MTHPSSAAPISPLILTSQPQMNRSAHSAGKAQHVPSAHRRSPGWAPCSLTSLIYIPATPRLELTSNESQFEIKSRPGITVNLPNSFNLGCQLDLKLSASPNVHSTNWLCPSHRGNEHSWRLSCLNGGTGRSPWWGWTPNPTPCTSCFYSN